MTCLDFCFGEILQEMEKWFEVFETFKKKHILLRISWNLDLIYFYFEFTSW